ncbi:hypothetical protein SAMN05216207_105813 [Pseudonocardia ammonioxydans]|uniref:Excreted virulence factor EspC, type VII ESX diderm n=1 Tax=Pseudonocardia ammonioxydans TaxID=260086 RepID=A0A1I5H630_PSUAM|nr:hypothetical protein [Pseudonocardia ammonioxydans]SFO43715.1 hypothetical protein SAMN05216207_105813 [Pseudonocardia ammonioxydans]
MTELQDTLTTICNQLAAVVQQQADDPNPSHDDFHTWGWALSELLDRTYQVALVLEEQVTHYGDTRILSDDEGASPAGRLLETVTRLVQTREALAHAQQHLSEYHAAISHISVMVDPNAEVGS